MSSIWRRATVVKSSDGKSILISALKVLSDLDESLTRHPKQNKSLDICEECGLFAH